MLAVLLLKSDMIMSGSTKMTLRPQLTALQTRTLLHQSPPLQQRVTITTVTTASWMMLTALMLKYQLLPAAETVEHLQQAILWFETMQIDSVSMHVRTVS